MNKFSTITNTLNSSDFKAIITAFSSFPDYVTRTGYGNDTYGEFEVSEIAINLNLQSKGCIAGDYASIHPIRNNRSGGTWVPRIDFINNDKLYYHRYRREQGGYIKAAKEVISDPNYSQNRDYTNRLWGDNEIILAANEEPSGKSPSHWIAVRVNLYMTYMYNKFKNSNNFSL